MKSFVAFALLVTMLIGCSPKSDESVASGDSPKGQSSQSDAGHEDGEPSETSDKKKDQPFFSSAGPADKSTQESDGETAPEMPSGDDVSAQPLSDQPPSDQPLSNEQLKAVIEQLGGSFLVDKDEPGHPITYVSFAGSDVRDGDIAHLKWAPNLEGLRLDRTNVGDGALTHVAPLTTLRSLDLEKTRVTDSGLRQLKSLQGLDRLILMDTDIGDAGLKHLSSLNTLEYLVLINTNISDAGLVHLNGMQGLEDLNIIRTNISDAGLAALKDLPNLKTIFAEETQITGSGLIHLKGLPKLDGLYLKSSRVVDAGLADLKSLPQLKSLDLDSTSVSDAGLPYISDLSELEALNLSATRVSDAGLAHLASLKNLKYLTLTQTGIRGEGLAALKGLAIQELDLRGTKVTDEAIEDLIAIPLYRLDVTDTGVTLAGMKKLQAALPECRIAGYEAEATEPHDPEPKVAVNDNNAIGTKAGDAKASDAKSEAAVTPPSALSAPRVWSDSSGNFKLEAKFVRMEGGFVVLQRTDNNREFRLTMGILSEADREFLRKGLDAEEPASDAGAATEGDPPGTGKTADSKPPSKPVKAVAGRNGVLAVAGFNSRKGIGTRSGQRGPYQLDTLSPSAGTGEGGWSGPWSATAKATAQSESVFEGDGALHLAGTAGVRRSFAGPLVGVVEIEQYVRIPTGGHVICYIWESNSVTSGPMWTVSDGKFRALAGDERGSGDWQDTGVAAKEDEWHRVVTEIDTEKRRWRLLLPELGYASEELKYRGTPQQLLAIHYLAEKPAGVFIDALQVRKARRK